MALLVEPYIQMEKIFGLMGGSMVALFHAPSTSVHLPSPSGVCTRFSCDAGLPAFISPTRPLREARMSSRRFRNLVANSSAVDETPSPSLPSSFDNQRIAPLKLKLLSIVSGLNRGLAATKEDMDMAAAAAKDVETAGGLVDLTCDIEKLQGRWRLVYSSAFSSRTVGGSRPGPPLGRLLPITLEQVFQRIDVVNKDFDNIVQIELGAPWPLPPVQLTATLAHKFELTGSANVSIKFEKTTVKTAGILSQLPLLEIPRIPDALRPPSNPGSGDFEVTYADSDMRITRGDRGELRVFVVA